MQRALRRFMLLAASLVTRSTKKWSTFRDCDEGVPDVPNLQHASCVRALPRGPHSTDWFSELASSRLTKQRILLHGSPMLCIRRLVQSLTLDAAINFGTVLHEVWYFHHVLGAVSTLLAVPDPTRRFYLRNLNAGISRRSTRPLHRPATS